MKASDLLSAIKKEMEDLGAISIIGEKLAVKQADREPISFIMTRYNYENLIEMMSLSEDSVTFDIDDDRLRDFRFRLDRHLDLHASGDAELKRFIRGVSTYLAFIARKPLHPPALTLPGKSQILVADGSYYCVGKRKHIKDELSLCRYCVCKAYRDMP